MTKPLSRTMIMCVKEWQELEATRMAMKNLLWVVVVVVVEAEGVVEWVAVGVVEVQGMKNRY